MAKKHKNKVEETKVEEEILEEEVDFDDDFEDEDLEEEPKAKKRRIDMKKLGKKAKIVLGVVIGTVAAAGAGAALYATNQKKRFASPGSSDDSETEGEDPEFEEIKENSEESEI